MHDPSTVAHDIYWPIRVTIWHEDPMNFEDKCGCRGDDSCGWFRPPYSKADKAAIEKLSKDQYRQIFNKQDAIAKDATYVSVCIDADCHAAVYWSWRAIKHKFKPRGPWQYGAHLTAGEKEAIYDLATCPVDNLMLSHSQIKNEETFEEFFFIVYGAYRRYHRPWYKHPKWHVHHWRFQIHVWQTFRRWAFDHCAGCGKGFSWGYSPTGFVWDPPSPKWFCSATDVYHSECASARTSLRTPEGNA